MTAATALDSGLALATRRGRLVLASTAMASAIGQLDGTVVNVALPRDLGRLRRHRSTDRADRPDAAQRGHAATSTSAPDVGAATAMSADQVVRP